MVKPLGFDAMWLYISLDVLHKTGALPVHIATPLPRASRGLLRLADKASEHIHLCLKRASLSLSLCVHASVRVRLNAHR